MRYAVAVAGLVTMLGCGADTPPFLGPGDDDPVCSTWNLATVNGQAIPVEIGGRSITGGSVQLLCTGFYRMTQIINSVVPMEFVGRYEETGTSIAFSSGPGHAPMSGTVSGTTLTVQSVPAGAGSATYERQ